MDPVTHTLIGVGMAHAFFRPRIGRGAVPTMLLASNLPDIDALVHLTGDPAAILMRRTFGHSLLTFPLWSLALAFILSRFYPQIGLKRLYGMALLGSGVHVFFDLINSFGVVPLWPITHWRPELAIVFIIDLTLTGLLLFPLIVCIPKILRPYLTPLSKIAIACMALYIVFCGANRMLAQQALASESIELGIEPEFHYVFPEPLGPHRWRGVIREKEQYWIFLIHTLSGQIELKRSLETAVGNHHVEAARKTDLARGLEWFFKAPVWTIKENFSPSPFEVGIYDLRFMSLVIQRDLPFVYRFHVYQDGHVEGIVD